MPSSTPDPSVFSAGAEKLLHFPEQLAAWRQGAPAVPVTLEIQPSERCNHACPACQARYSTSLRDVRRRARRGAFLDLELLSSVWDDPPRGIVVSGNTGDPLLHPEIGGLLKELRAHAIPTVLITNGEALDDEIAEIAVSSCRGIRVSMDAASPGHFRRTHGASPESWFLILQNLARLVEVRDALGLGSADCLIGAGYLTSASTMAEIPAAARLARSVGADYLQLRPFHYDRTPIRHVLEATRAETESPHFRIYASDQKYDRFPSPWREYSRCMAAWFYTVLDAQGDFYICCHHVTREDARLGSLHETRWSEFLTSPRRAAVIEGFTTDGCIPFCRLHTQNDLLHGLKTRVEIAPPELPAEVMWHTPFL